MSNPHNLKVGQKLWFVGARGFRNEYEVEIINVGRVYASISRAGRIFLDTLLVDGGGYSSPGRCYLSRDAWDAEKSRDLAWANIRSAISQQHSTPKDFDPIKLAEISKLLGVYIEEAKWPPVKRSGDDR